MAPTYHHLSHYGVFQELLGSDVKEAGEISESNSKTYGVFQNWKLIEVQGVREVRIPLQGSKGAGDFVCQGTREGGKWKKKRAFIETATACYPEDGGVELKE